MARVERIGKKRFSLELSKGEAAYLIEKLANTLGRRCYEAADIRAIYDGGWDVSFAIHVDVNK